MKFILLFVSIFFSVNFIYSQPTITDSTDFSKDVWKNLGPGYNFFTDFIILDDNANSIIVSSNNHGIIKTYNGGLNWSKFNNGLNNLQVQLISVSPGDTNKILAATFPGGLYFSENSGNSWEELNIFNSILIMSITFDKNFSDTIYVGTDSLGLFRSVDGGKNWNKILIPSLSGVNSVVINPLDSKIIYISTHYRYSSQKRQIFKSTDFGSAWTEIYSSNLDIKSIYINHNNPNIIFCNVESNRGDKLLKSTNEGMSWETIFDDGFFITDLIFHPKNEEEIFILKNKDFRGTYFSEFIKSKDGGYSWSTFTRFSLPGAVKIDFSTNSVSTLFALDHNNGLHKISNNQLPKIDYEQLNYYPLKIGNKWRYMSRNCTVGCDTVYFTKSLVSKEVKPNGKEYYKLYTSRNNESFIRIDTTYMLVMVYNTSEPDSEFILYDLYTPHEKPYAVFDNTKEFNFDFVRTGYMQVGALADSSFYKEYSHDGLIGYTKILSKDFGPSYLLTGEGNLYEETLIGAKINGVEYGLLTDINSTETIPAKFVLEQNYPNPFNPTTTIKYSIPKITNLSIPSREGKERSDRGVSVKLKVYDVLCREVATLVNKRQKPGKYKTVFNASNLSSGIYYYLLNINGNVLSKKMILLK